MERRGFIRSSTAVLGLGVLSVSAFIEACRRKDPSTQDPQGPVVNFTIDLSQPSNKELTVSGGSLSTHGIIVANTGGSYAAVSQKCTHQGCSVGYNASGSDFVCPCHGGTYSLTGAVLSGPPPAPLKSYKVTRNGNLLTVAG